MRKLTISLVASQLIFASPLSAQVAPLVLTACGTTQINANEADRICTVGADGSSGSSSRDDIKSGSSASPSGTTKRWLPYDKLTTAPDGQPCMTTGYHEEGTIPTDGVPANPAYPQPFIYANLAYSYPSCPEAPADLARAAPVETPRMVAARYWQRVPLPKPQPSIAPGRAITGKTAYLNTAGRTTDSYHENTVYGSLELRASGRYLVDWGDGETSGPFSFEGTAWPSGQITHEYQRVGVYNIVVTEKWSGTWELAGQSGVLSEVQTVGRINEFPVEEIQAVIVK